MIELDLENSPVVVRADDVDEVRVEKRFTTGWIGVRAGTSNGAITGTGLRSSEVELSTSNGRVELTFAEAPRTVDVHTSNGRVEVVLPDDSPPYALSTSTSNGNVATAIRTDPAAADNSIDVSTSNGDITVRYP